VAAASKSMGIDFGQSKAIGEPMGPVDLTQITQYTRTISFAPASGPAALVSRATGPTQPPAIPGVPAQPPGVLNQNVTGAQAIANRAQALTIWTTPWRFVKGAAANNATVQARGRAAGRVALARELQVTVRPGVHGDGLPQRPESVSWGRHGRGWV
jgi:hypothetical protein